MLRLSFFLRFFFRVSFIHFIHIGTLRLIRGLSPETYISSIIIG